MRTKNQPPGIPLPGMVVFIIMRPAWAAQNVLFCLLPLLCSLPPFFLLNAWEGEGGDVMSFVSLRFTVPFNRVMWVWVPSSRAWKEDHRRLPLPYTLCVYLYCVFFFSVFFFFPPPPPPVLLCVLTCWLYNFIPALGMQFYAVKKTSAIIGAKSRANFYRPAKCESGQGDKLGAVTEEESVRLASLVFRSHIWCSSIHIEREVQQYPHSSLSDCQNTC